MSNKALNRLNLTDSPFNNARAIEALNFPDQEVAELFAANDIFAECHPMYADTLVIAMIDTTAELIRLHPKQESQHLHIGFLLFQRLLLGDPDR